MNDSQIVPGLYKHYKGSYYHVTAIALHSETHQPYIVYHAAESSDQYPAGTTWVRPLSMFIENVSVEGHLMPRFKRV